MSQDAATAASQPPGNLRSLERKVLDDLGADVRRHMNRLPHESQWRSPLSYLADRLEAGRPQSLSAHPE